MKKLVIILLIFFQFHLHSQEVYLNFVIVLSEVDTTQHNAEQIDSAINVANAIFNDQFSHHRNISFSFEINEIGGSVDPFISNKYYEIQGDHDNVREIIMDIEDEAINDPSRYQWKSNAINIYLIDKIVGSTSGICSFPPGSFNGLVSNEVIIVEFRENHSSFARTILHEIGHFFNLCHSFGCSKGTNNDKVDDTLEDPNNLDDSDETTDLSEATQKDNIALENFGVPYDSPNLSSDQRNRINTAFNNLMSYNGGSELTRGQLDRWQDAIRNESTRQDVVSTAPIFVNPGSRCGILNNVISCDGSSTKELPYLYTGNKNAYFDGLDLKHRLIILRPGTYNEGNFIWTKNCIMAGDGRGSAIIR